MKTCKRWIGAAEAGSNPKIYNFDSASIRIQDDVAGIDIFMNDVSGMDFAFSVEHPVITSCNRGWIDGTPRQDWIC
jgi:hypothetical protein